jgi:hypothetical protein
MRSRTVSFVLVFLFVRLGLAAPRQHLVAFGKWTTVRVADENKDVITDLKIRLLYVDGITKEFTVGPAHDVTDRTFVVQRMYRLNDSLPQESGAPRWRWQGGGWLLVDRVSGKIQRLTLPELDPDSSSISWFRDYAAYCTDQLPLCSAPTWQRAPVWVTFATKSDQAMTFNVKSTSVDLATEDTNEGEE